MIDIIIQYDIYFQYICECMYTIIVYLFYSLYNEINKYLFYFVKLTKCLLIKKITLFCKK